MSYRCECNQGYIGDGIDCIGELILAGETMRMFLIMLGRPTYMSPDLGFTAILSFLSAILWARPRVKKQRAKTSKIKLQMWQL